MHDLHPVVKDAAVEYCKGGHHRAAVDEAARNVNAMLQNKVGIWTTGERGLIEQVFSDKPPAPGLLRLRPSGDRHTPTYNSRLDGMKGLGVACYGGIRNVSAHSTDIAWDKAYGIHLLAMFSLLAFWIDDCVVDHT